MSDREKQLERALRDMLSGWKYIRSFHGDLYGVGWDRAQQKAEEALANDDAGGGDEKPPHLRPRLEPKYSGVIDTSSQHRGALAKKLEGIAYAKPGKIEADLSQVAIYKHHWYHIQNTAMTACRVLTAPPTVPESIRRLPDEFDYRARCVSDLSSALWKVAANRVREALAQHSEPGRIPEGYCLVPAEPTREIEMEQWKIDHEDYLRSLLRRKQHPTPYWSDPLKSMEDEELPSEAEILEALDELEKSYE